MAYTYSWSGGSGPYTVSLPTWNLGSQTTATISAADLNFPTSSYGGTIPVLYGKVKVGGGYVWASDITRTTDTRILDYFIDYEFVPTTVVTVTSYFSARIRFGAPLEQGSQWAIRKLYIDGAVAFDSETGYRQPGLIFRFYDGRQSQDRDSIEVAVEGEANVSAHRGYLDVVIVNYNLGESDTPPFFEAEIIQDPEISVAVDAFEGFASDAINSWPCVNFATGEFYGITTGPPFRVRRFNIAAGHEVYSIPITEDVLSIGFIYEGSVRYVPQIDRIICLISPGAGHPKAGIVIDPSTGFVVGEAEAFPDYDPLTTTVHARINNISFLISAAFLFDAVFVFSFGAASAELTYESGSAWGGYGTIHAMAVGAQTARTAEILVCADSVISKAVLHDNGFLDDPVTLATLPDPGRYCLFFDNDIFVWTDNAELIRINGTTGATIWTVALTYQVNSIVSFPNVAPPDMNRFDGKFYFEEATAYNLTDLTTGETTSLARGSAPNFRYVYDGAANIAIVTDNATYPTKLNFNAVGSGTERNLSDFMEALTVAGGFEASEIDISNIDDLIDGSVIDQTSGVRDVARSVAFPYSFAMHERAGQIIYRRAATDGGFVVDAVIAISDLIDRGGQAIKARRFNPEEFIAKFGINYRDPAEIYQPRAQYGEIPTLPFPVAPTDISVKADMPIITSADNVKTIATKKVNRMAVEKHEFTLHLRARFADLEPEDIIQFDFSGRTIIARVIETIQNPDCSIELKATEFLSGVAVSINGAVGNPGIPLPTGSPASRYHHLDIPLLAVSHDLGSAGLVQYHALTSAGQLYWDGATLYRSEGAGAYVPVAAQVNQALTGFALTALGDTANPYVTEFEQTFDVSFLTGDETLLASATYLEVMNGANLFAIGAPGRWEICQVIDIADNADGSYTFSGLVRGRGSSEEFTGDHAIGDSVIMLATNISLIEYGLDALNDTMLFKPVGIGGNLPTTIALSRVITGEAERIPKPSQLDASLSGGIITFEWVRSARSGVLGGFWQDDGAYITPLGETLERYTLKVLSGPGGSVLRTVTVDDAQDYDYSAANQTTDFGSGRVTGDNITFTVLQVSGTGVVCPAREATITL